MCLEIYTTKGTAQQTTKPNSGWNVCWRNFERDYGYRDQLISGHRYRVSSNRASSMQQVSCRIVCSKFHSISGEASIVLGVGKQVLFPCMDSLDNYG